MATTMRSVDTRFWIDGWVRKLNALDRYVFLYFLTNPHSSWCGVYEVDLGMVSYETGIEETELRTVILPRLEPKVRYLDGWVYIPNFERYHANHSEKTQKGIENAWKTVPERIRIKIRGSYPIEGVSAFASASTSASISDKSQKMKKNSFRYNENKQEDFEEVIDADTMEEREDPEDRVNQRVTEMIEWAEEARGKKFFDRPTQRKMIHDLRKQGIDPARIKQKYQELLASDFWRGKAQIPDFKTVFSNLKNER